MSASPLASSGRNSRRLRAPTGEGVVTMGASTPAAYGHGAQVGPPGTAAALDVAVVVRGEVIRRGIAELIQGMSEVGTVQAYASPDEFERTLHTWSPQTIVVTTGELAWLESPSPALAGEVTVLVAVDQGSLGEVPAEPPGPVSGYLWLPSLTPSAMRDALRQRRRGEVVLPYAMVQAILARTGGSAPPRSRPIRLTGRERDALAYLVEGLSNKQIARRLAISSHSAKRLVASVMLKLDAPNRTMAAVTAVRTGLVDVN